MADTIHRGEACEPDWHLTRKNARTGVPEPLDEDTPVSWWLSATYKGDPIDPETVVTLTRRQRELREDARTSWFGILERDTVSDLLQGILTGGTVYEVVDVDGERKSRALTVAD